MPIIRSLVAALWALLLLAFAVGCGDDAGTNAGDEPTGSLRGRTFVSESVVEDGQARPLPPGTEIRLVFHEDGRLTASAGCNTMGGPVDLGSSRLEIDDLSITEMGCDGPRHEQDEWLSGLLTADPAYTLDGSRLTIRTDRTVVTLTDTGPG